MSISDFLDCMPDTVTLAKKTGVDMYGKPTYATPTPYPARVIYKTWYFRSPTGQEIVALGSVWLGVAVVVGPEDKLVLPDGTCPPNMFSNRFTDEKGFHHTKIIFG